MILGDCNWHSKTAYTSQDSTAAPPDLSQIAEMWIKSKNIVRLLYFSLFEEVVSY
jgi:hypothetical protein